MLAEIGIVATDLLEPGQAGTVGVTIGGIGLLAFIRAVFQLGQLKGELTTFLKNLAKSQDAQQRHYTEEARHHARVEDLLARIEHQNRVGVPRPVSQDHTPVQFTPPDPPPGPSVRSAPGG